MGDLRPVSLEVEGGVVVQIVTLHAHLHDVPFGEFLTGLVSFPRQSSAQSAESSALCQWLLLALLYGYVAGSRAMAILAAVANQPGVFCS
jgi:hypothetical protein